nr:hypothetical protein [Plasmopara viticola lesion associated mononegaambi virus 2]
MNVGTVSTRQLYARAWVLYNLNIMANNQASKAEGSKKRSDWAETEESIADFFDAEGIQPIPIGQMMEQVEKLDKGVKIKDEKLDGGKQTETRHSTKDDEKEELLKLFSPSKPDPPRSNSARPMSSDRGHSEPKSKPLVDISDEHLEADYPESFASQVEMTELRESFEAMTEKYTSLEEKMDLIMKERENIPLILKNMQIDLNNQLTMFSDKLYQSLESRTPETNVEAAMTVIEQIRADHNEQFKTAVSHASAEPTATSPLTRKSGHLKGKGRFKAIE